MVLAPTGITIYKDHTSALSKPWMIIPLNEIQDAEIYRASERRFSFEDEPDKSMVRKTFFDT
jgi:hypothetical protein